MACSNPPCLVVKDVILCISCVVCIAARVRYMSKEICIVEVDHPVEVGGHCPGGQKIKYDKF